MLTEKLPVTLDWDPKDNPNPTFVESKQHAKGRSGMQRGECEWGISAESLDHNKPPPSLILKIELFAFLAIFVRYPLIKM